MAIFIGKQNVLGLICQRDLHLTNRRFNKLCCFVKMGRIMSAKTCSRVHMYIQNLSAMHLLKFASQLQTDSLYLPKQRIWWGEISSVDPASRQNKGSPTKPGKHREKPLPPPHYCSIEHAQWIGHGCQAASPAAPAPLPLLALTIKFPQKHMPLRVFPDIFPGIPRNVAAGWVNHSNLYSVECSWHAPRPILKKRDFSNDKLGDLLSNPSFFPYYSRVINRQNWGLTSVGRHRNNGYCEWGFHGLMGQRTHVADLLWELLSPACAILLCATFNNSSTAWCGRIHLCHQNTAA